MRNFHYKSHVKVRRAFASEIKVGTAELVIASLTPIVGSIDGGPANEGDARAPIKPAFQ